MYTQPTTFPAFENSLYSPSRGFIFYHIMICLVFSYMFSITLLLLPCFSWCCYLHVLANTACIQFCSVFVAFLSCFVVFSFMFSVLSLLRGVLVPTARTLACCHDLLIVFAFCYVSPIFSMLTYQFLWCVVALLAHSYILVQTSVSIAYCVRCLMIISNE